MKTVTTLLLFFALLHFTTTAQVLEQDSLALVAFYNSTGGLNWNNNSNWLTGPVSTWYGVTVEGKRVKELKFYSDNNLNGVLPEEIGNLNEIEKLVISNNPSLYGILPNTIGQLLNLLGIGIGNCALLEFLNLPQNNLTGPIPPEIGNLDNLLFLDLHDNQLSGTIPPELGNLDNLLELHLNKNVLIGKLPVNLEGILDNAGSSGHVIFDVSENQLTDSIPFTWANIEILFAELDFSWNNFTDIPPWNGNWILNSLGIRGNKMTFEDIEPHFVGYSLFGYAPQQPMGDEIDTLLPIGQSYRIYSGTAGEFTNYEWYHNNTLIAQGPGLDTLKFENISYADTGVYFCYATNTLATELLLKRKDVHIGIDTSVSVFNIQNEDIILISPNPSNGTFTISVSDILNLLSINVYNLYGKNVYNQITNLVENGSHQLNLSHLAPGQYILQLQLKNKNQTHKVLIF